MARYKIVVLVCLLGFLGLIKVGAQTNCTSTIVTTPASCFGGTDGTAKVVLPNNGSIAATSCAVLLVSNVTCTSGCTQTVSSNTGDITVGPGQKVCITASNFTGGITVSGGTLVICGSASPSYFNLNNNGLAFDLIINGSLKLDWLNGNPQVSVRNFGTLTVNGAGLNGPLENNGTFIVNSTFNQNNPSGGFINRGTTTILNGDFNNNTSFVNGGIINVSGSFNNNSNSIFTNSCTVTVGNNFFINGGTTAINNGSIKLTSTNGTNELTVNGSGLLKVDAGSLIEAKRLTNNARIEGIGATCGLIKISGNTLINSGAVFAGKVDLCDANGIETNNGVFQSPATNNCSCSFASATYAWSSPFNNVTGNTVTNIKAGIPYFVNVQLAGCPLQKLDFTIPSPSQLIVTVNKTELVANAVVQGGTPNYTYAWQGASGTSSSQTYTQAGTYELTVTDSKSCSQKNTFTLTTTPPPSCNFTVQTTNPLCSDGKGTATILKNGQTYTPSSNSGSGVVANSCTTPLTSTTNCTTGCGAPVGDFENINVITGQKVCITSSNYRGGINVSGGTLVICGDAIPSYFNLNNNGQPFTLVINGSLKLNSLNGNPAVTVLNYGTLTVDGAGLNGPFENNGTFIVNGTFNQNTANGSLINRGTINITNGDFNNNTTFTNSGIIKVSGSFNNNSNSTFTNVCTVSVGNNFFVNAGTIAVNNGSVKLESINNPNSTNELTVNGNGLLRLGAGSLFEAKRLVNNARIEGTGLTCGSLKISGNTLINSGAVFAGRVDLCDANGIETNNGVFQSPATSNCSCTSTSTASNAVSWQAPLSGSSSTQSNLSGDTYSVIINETGCAPETLTFTIQNPPSPIVATYTSVGLTATIIASGGTGSLRYTWPNQAPSADNSFSFNNAGTYNVIITDANACTKTETVTVSSSGTGSPTDGTCQKVSVEYLANNKIKVSCVCPGDCFPVDVNGNPTANPFDQPKNDSTITLKSPNGLFTIVVKGSGGNGGGSNTNLITFTTSVSPETGIGKNDGVIKINDIKTSSGEFTIITNGNNQQNTGTITNLPGGDVKVTICDPKVQICTTFVVTVPVVPPLKVEAEVVSSPGPTIKKVEVVIEKPKEDDWNIICPITISYSFGGTQTINCNEFTGNPTSSTFIKTFDIPNTVAGPIVITIKDVKGNTIVIQKSLGEKCIATNPFVPQYSFVEPSCFNGANGSITLQNPPANSTVTWSKTKWYQSGNTVNQLTKGDYRIIIELPVENTGKKCTLFEGPVSLNEPQRVKVVASRIIENSFSALASGGTSIYTYQWDGKPAGPSASYTVAGTYHVIATDSKGCTGRDFVIVRPSNCLGLFTINSTDPKCIGEANGSMAGSFSDLSATTLWSGTGITNAYNKTQTGLKANDYTFTARKWGPDCISFVTVKLKDPKPLVVKDVQNGKKVDILVSGGKSNYQVKWLFDNKIVNTRSDLEPGTVYSLEITDANLCKASYSFKFDPCADNPIKVVVDVAGSSATPEVKGGTGPFTYLWTPVTLGVTLTNPPIEKIQPNLPNGTFKLVVTDATGNCKGEATVVAPNCGLNPLPTVEVKKAPTCGQRCDGVGILNVTNLISGAIISWNGQSSNKEIINACANIPYPYTVESATGCRIKGTHTFLASNLVCPEVSNPCAGVSITSNAVSTSKLNKKCFNEKTFVDINVKGGLAPLTFSWKATYTIPKATVNGAVITEEFESDKEDLDNPFPGTYILKVTDANKCTSSDDLTVQVGGPVSTLEVTNTTTQATCVGGKAIVEIIPTGGSGSYSYKWNDGYTSKTRNIDILSSATSNTYYQVEVTDGGGAGCTVTTDVSILNPVFNGSISASQPTICNLLPAGADPTKKVTVNPVQLTALIVEGYSVLWTGTGISSPFNTFFTVNVTEPGVYNVKYSKTGCSDITQAFELKQSNNCPPVKDYTCENVELEFVDIPEPTETNCELQQKIAADANALFQYANYLEEKKRDFRSRFVKSIMDNMDETLTMSYSDDELHYTLYYYDQAGNLVRTVPPEGVVKLDKDQTTAAIQDLKDNKVNTFTKHNYATTYRYNTLNQLVSQDMPDHDPIDLWETADAKIDLEGRTIGMVDYSSANNGLLIANTATEGALYTTSDTGIEWTKVGNIGMDDILDVWQVDDKAFAVGKGGSFATSTDGGDVWILKTTPITTDLERVYFSDANTGIVMNKNGAFWNTTDGGDSWSATAYPLPTGFALSDVSFDGSNILVVGIESGKSKIYRSANKAATWTSEEFDPSNFTNSVTVGGKQLIASNLPGTLFWYDGAKISIVRTKLTVGIEELLPSGTVGVVARGTDKKLYNSTGDFVDWTPNIYTGADVNRIVAVSTTRNIAYTGGTTFVENSASTKTTLSGLSTTLNNIRESGKPILDKTATNFDLAVGDKVLYKEGSTWNTIAFKAGTAGNIIDATTGDVKDVFVVSADKWLLLTTDGIVLETTSPDLEQISLAPASKTRPVNTLKIANPSFATNIDRFVVLGGNLYMVSSGGEVRRYETVSGTLSSIITTIPAFSSSTNVEWKLDGTKLKGLATYTNGTIQELNNNAWLPIQTKFAPAILNAITPNFVAGGNSEVYKLQGSKWVYAPYALTGTSVNMFKEAVESGVAGNVTLATKTEIFQLATTGVMNTLTKDVYTGTDITKLVAGSKRMAIDNSKVVEFNGTWTETYAPTTFVDALAIGVAGGPSGTLHHLDAGTWKPSTPIKIQPLNAFATGDGFTVAVGQNGTIISSQGGTYTPRFSNTSYDLTHVAAIGSKAMAGGENGLIRYSIDKATNFTSLIPPPAYTNLRGISTFGTAFALLADSKLLTYTSSFSTTTLPSPAYDAVLGSDNKGFLVGDGGMVYRVQPKTSFPSNTANLVDILGTDLAMKAIATDANLTDGIGTGLPVANYRKVQTSDQLIAYVTTSTGQTYKTTDGGEHWNTSQTSGNGGVPSLAPTASTATNNQGSLLSGNKLQYLVDKSQVQSSRFWYDELGRLCLSQNSKQFNVAKHKDEEQYKNLAPSLFAGTDVPRAYSYTLYDDIGRIVEVGEVITTATLATAKHESQVNYRYLVETFVSSGTRHQVTNTYYDEAVASNVLTDFTQDNLRPRVATVTYTETPTTHNPQLVTKYDQATHYSYDIHGNVKTIVQQIGCQLSIDNCQLTKRIDYEYDLISGKVNRVYYQKGKSDQLIHQYSYDGDNRISKVETSKDGLAWTQEAIYHYYPHGPLSRTEIGQQKVEIQNYAYTLQGWIKAMSGGHFSYALGYHKDDYTNITGTTGILATPIDNKKDLYNGNIATWASKNSTGVEGILEPTWTQQFEYDQLNRIKASKTVGNTASLSSNYTYDANGNLMTLNRFDGSGIQFDQLGYNYQKLANGYQRNTNRLTSVSDMTSDRLDDMEGQLADNYGYDEIGNLNRDDAEKIANIEWNTYGKVKRVQRLLGSGKMDLYFEYDASGNRVLKTTKIDERTVNTFYVRDAQGNVMGTYEEGNGKPLGLQEQYLYGSSRVGVLSGTGRSYELTDHLGNVRAVVSDANKVLTATDYYPFGFEAKGYKLEGYRYGFNGKEKDDEGMGGGLATYDYGFRIYNPAIAKFLSIDPLSKKFPWYTPYQFAGNKPIRYIDLDGSEEDEPLAFSWANSITNSGLRIPFFGQFILKKKLEQSGIQNPDDEMLENFVVRMRTIAVGEPYFDWQTNTYVQDYQREAVIEPKQSTGAEAFEAFVDILTILPNTKGGKGSMPGVAMAQGGQIARLSLASFLKLMQAARKFEAGVIKKAIDSKVYTTVQTQVTLRLKNGTTARFDGVGKKSDGTYDIIEAKMGGGKLSDNQREVLKAIKNGDEVKAIGDNAEKIFGQGSSGKNVVNKINDNVNLNNVNSTVDQVLKAR